MTLRVGSSLASAEGKEFLKFFIEMVYLDPSCRDLEKFDIWCEVVTKQFQSMHGLKVDGIYGPNTKSKIMEVFHSHRSQHGTIGGPAYLEEWRDRVVRLRPTLSNWAYTYGPLVVALEEMEAGATEVGGNNQGDWVAKYHRVKPSVLDGRWAWCAAFVSWCYNEAAIRGKVPMPFEYTGSAQRAYKNMGKSKHCGKTFGTDYEMVRPGNIVVWWRGAIRTWKGHIEMVFIRYGNILVTIGGNVGAYPAKVRLFSYHLGHMPKLIGFAGV